MSEENLAVVFEHIDAINRGDVEAVVATVSPDVEWEDAMFYSESPRIYRGKGEVREWFHRVLEPWESFHAEPDKIREASDGRILVGGTITARGKGSGAETRLSGWFLFWVADRIITKRRPFLDYDEALEAAGLRE
jgi:ketosteroid isomerase-like protein